MSFQGFAKVVMWQARQMWCRLPEQPSRARTSSLLPRREMSRRSLWCHTTTFTLPLPVKTCWPLSQSASGVSDLFALVALHYWFGALQLWA